LVVVVVLLIWLAAVQAKLDPSPKHLSLYYPTFSAVCHYAISTRHLKMLRESYMPRIATLRGSRVCHWCGCLKVLDRIMFRYCPLLNRMQLAFRARVQFLDNHGDGRSKRKQVGSVKDLNLSLHGLLSTGHRLLVVSLITSLQLHLYTALTTQTATEHNCIVSHAQNTTALQSSVFLTGIYRLLGTNKGRSAFPSADNYQGQLQSPQSVSVVAHQAARERRSKGFCEEGRLKLSCCILYCNQQTHN
jgi:hypothetical protein